MHWLHICCIVLAVGGALNLWLVVRVLRPLWQLSQRAERLATGDFHSIDKPCCYSISEIQQLQRALAGMARHIRNSQQHQQSYISALTTGQENERSRLAHELHDETTQSLIAIGQQIDLAQHFVPQEPALAATMLQQARQQVTTTVTNLRNIIANLRPPALDELGLVTALRLLSERLPDKVTLQITGHERRLDEQHELTLFRCAQEAINNIQKHATVATQVAITLHYAIDCIQLIVHDNGQGFTVPDTLDELVLQQHFGLVGIQERVRQLHGQLRLDSNPDSGTTLQLWIPTIPVEQPTNTVKDPVCSTLIHPQQAYGSLNYAQQRWYFCCPVCQGSFSRNPELYINVPITP